MSNLGSTSGKILVLLLHAKIKLYFLVKLLWDARSTQRGHKDVLRRKQLCEKIQSVCGGGQIFVSIVLSYRKALIINYLTISVSKPMSPNLHCCLCTISSNSKWGKY